MVCLLWQPHPILSDHRRASYVNDGGAFSIVNGPCVSEDEKYEVYTPDGNILRFKTEEEVIQYIT